MLQHLELGLIAMREQHPALWLIQTKERACGLYGLRHFLEKQRFRSREPKLWLAEQTQLVPWALAGLLGLYLLLSLLTL